MKEFSKQYRIRECGYYTASPAMLSYEYDYSRIFYFPSAKMYAPEMRVTNKYKVI